MVESGADVELEKGDGDFGRSFRGGGEHLEDLRVRSGSDGGAVGVEEGSDGREEFGGEERFELLGVVAIRFDDFDDGEAGLFDDALIGVAEDVLDDGHDVLDHVERVEGESATAVRSGGDGGSLDVE